MLTGHLRSSNFHSQYGSHPSPTLRIQCRYRREGQVLEDVPNWEFSVTGLVETPLLLTLRQLQEDFEQFTYPITLVCAGNRRKEQNVVRKSKGFSWGAAGVSTAIWTGVPLCYLLSKAMPKRGARYVCFEGADEPSNGHYGTSVKLSWARDPERGILVAHKMNGEPLPPNAPDAPFVGLWGGGRALKWWGDTL